MNENNLNYNIKIVDNFLSEEDFNNLNKQRINKNINEGIEVYHNEINNEKIITSVIDQNLLTKIHKNYHSKAMEILKELCPEKAELYDYSDFTIIVTSKKIVFFQFMMILQIKFCQV